MEFTVLYKMNVECHSPLFIPTVLKNNKGNFGYHIRVNTAKDTVRISIYAKAIPFH